MESIRRRWQQLRRAARSCGNAVVGSPDTDDRVRAGRLAAALYAAGATDAALAGPHLAGVGVAAIEYAAAAAYGCVAVLLLIPWQRLPRYATAVPPLVSYLVLGVGGYFSHGLDHFQSFYPLAFIYLGLTQRPGVSSLFAVPAAASALVAAYGGHDASAALDLTGAIAVAALVGEVIAAVTRRSRAATQHVRVLLTAVSQLNAAPDEAAAANLLAALTAGVLHVDGVAVMLAEHPGARTLRNRGQVNCPIEPDTMIADLDRGTSGARLALTTGRSVFVSDAPASGRVAQHYVERLRAASTVYVPVPGEGGQLGVIAAWWHRRQRSVEATALSATEVLARQAGEVLERLRSRDRLEAEARTDALTGLTNRRGLFEELTRLPVDGAIVMLDLDHFKALNDTLGHPAGDDVLQIFADTLRQSLRAGDCAARYGGEEFAIVLSGGAAGAAHATVQRISRRWTAAGAPRTFSAGIAVHRIGDTPAAALARADAALYAAKRGGRDRVVDAADLPEVELPASAPRPSVEVDLDRRR